MKVIEKDILTVESGIIVHQINCRGIMGTGIALALKNKWPIIFHNYKNLCNNYSSNVLLGTIDPVLVETKNGELWVVNLFGQDRYGRDRRYTSYGAWENALVKLSNFIKEKKLPNEVYFPFGCGCNNAGGDWEIVSRLIEEYLPDAIICKSPK